MKEELYNKVIAIHKRLDELNVVLNAISPSPEHKLNYVDDDNDGCSECYMVYIRELLDKHDTMIREEIKQEIKNLKKQIEEL